MKHGVHILDQASASHVHLTSTPFFGWSSVHSNGSFNLVGLHPIHHRNPSRHRSSAKEMVSTSMSCSSYHYRLTYRNCLLRHSWQRIKFGHDSDYWFARSVFSHKSSRDSCYSSGHFKSCIGKCFLKELGRVCFQIPKLWIAPDLAGQVSIEISLGIQLGKNFFLLRKKRAKRC